MERSSFVDAVDRITALLDSNDASTANTSMRIPHALREAASIAVRDLGVAGSTTALTNDALRSTLEAAVMQATLDDHYRINPRTRPGLADLAMAAAQLDGHPLAHHPALLRRAAKQIVQRHPDADADDVLLWAEAQLLASA
jgi:hypothetical protein